MKATVLLSGGQDSTTALFIAKTMYHEIEAIAFDYGQRHLTELDSAHRIAALANVPLEVVDIRGTLQAQGPLLDADAPLPGPDATGVQSTFVPLRNMLLLTIAANRAYVNGSSALVIGVSQVDYSGYPDCRQDFLQAMVSAFNHGAFTGEPGTRPNIKIHAPFLRMSKAEEVKLAVRIPGCYRALAYSHTAYDGSYPPRGEDNASILRAKGFADAGVPDPLILRAYLEGGLMELPDTPNYSGAVTKDYLPLLESVR